VVVGALPAGSLICLPPPASESDVVHDHVRLRQHQIVAITHTAISIGARRVQQLGTTDGGETVGGSSCGGQLSPGRAPAEMISDSCAYANGKVLIKSINEHLLPTTQMWGPRRPRPLVAAPDTGNRHIDLLCYFIPGEALITKLQDLLR
jgi:hypothetical protein